VTVKAKKKQLGDQMVETINEQKKERK